MSLFYAHYACHEGALVMRKSDGAIYRVRGNVSLWDMTAVLEPWDVENNKLLHVLEDMEENREVAEKILTVKSKEFSDKFLILDEGKDRLSEAFKTALSHVAVGKRVK